MADPRDLLSSADRDRRVAVLRAWPAAEIPEDRRRIAGWPGVGDPPIDPAPPPPPPGALALSGDLAGGVLLLEGDPQGGGQGLELSGDQG